MKKLFRLALIFTLAFLLMTDNGSRGVSQLPKANPEKLSTLIGVVDEETYKLFSEQMEQTSSLPGNRLIVINSPGGMVYFGQLMIDLMVKEQSQGVKMICKVEGQVSSMAFNLLSHCDVRLATKRSFGVVHKIAAVGICGMQSEMRCTAKNLRKEAKMLEEGDEPYRQKNAEVMGLSIEEYDTLADNETIWTASQLLKIGYLHAVL